MDQSNLVHGTKRKITIFEILTLNEIDPSVIA